MSISKDDLLLQTSALLSGCAIIPVLPNTLLLAADLVKRFKFQIFDAVIVAACLEGKVTILHLEDMQHGLVIDKNLTIINPFI